MSSRTDPALERIRWAMARPCECGARAGQDCLRPDGKGSSLSIHPSRFDPLPDGHPMARAFDRPRTSRAPHCEECGRKKAQLVAEGHDEACPNAATGAFWTGSFFLALEPRSKGNSKAAVAPGVVVARKGLSARENELRDLAREHAPPSPLVGRVRLDVEFVLGTKARVDRGNLLKLLEDALEGVFYADDSQVSAGDVSKRYAREGEPAGYRVAVSGCL